MLGCLSGRYKDRSITFKPMLNTAKRLSKIRTPNTPHKARNQFLRTLKQYAWIFKDIKGYLRKFKNIENKSKQIYS